jgi:His/Glu/Gln/Arg/opine family amino acid ABC transporter permease subunit
MTNFEFKWNVLSRYQDLLLQGTLMTIWLAVAGMALALVLGLIVALMRRSRFKPVSMFADAYIQVFRAMPLFVYLIWLFYGVAMISGINIPPITTALICLSMIHSAFLAETYRAGIEAVPRGHEEAAFSVGLSRFQVMRYIILPQAFRIVLPPIGNEFTIVFKSTTILGIIGVSELVKQTQFATTLSFRPFELYTALAVIFIILVIILSRLNLLLERRLKYA